MAKGLTAEERKALKQQELNEQLLDVTEKGDVAAIKQALKAGADIHARNDEQWAPLHVAAADGHSDAIKALLEAGAEVDLQNKHQDTPLHLAVWNGYSNAVRILLAAGASLNSRDEKGRTPIDDARNKERYDLVNDMQSVVDDPSKRPTPQSVALDMNKRNAALIALGEKPVIGAQTAAVNAQREAALHDPEQGILGTTISARTLSLHCLDNPDLPYAFIKQLLLSKQEMGDGELTDYRFGPI